MKVPAQNTEPDIPLVPWLRAIPTAIQPIARLQAVDRRLHARMPFPAFAKFDRRLGLLTGLLLGPTHGHTGCASPTSADSRPTSSGVGKRRSNDADPILSPTFFWAALNERYRHILVLHAVVQHLVMHNEAQLIFED